MNEPDEPQVAPVAPPLEETVVTDFFATDDRLVKVEGLAARHARHLAQLEGALSTQMISLCVLELCFALFLATVVWTEYRRRTESEVRHGAAV